MSLHVMDQTEAGAGKGSGAGDQAGEDYYEAEVSFMDLEETLFRELELPNLKKKNLTRSL